MLVEPPEILDSADLASAQQRVDRLLTRGAESLLIFAGEDSAIEADAWNGFLQALPVPVFGGVFPRVLSGGVAHARGVLIVGLSCRADVCIVEGLDDESAAFGDLQAQLAPLLGAQTVMMWVDGLSTHIEPLIGGIYDVLGSGPVFFGGGAGSSCLLPRPCLFSNRGLLGGAAMMVGLPVRIGVGVSHGWEPVAGPFLVSAVSRNRVQGLDFRPALAVYREEVRRLSGQLANADNFFGVARAFPLGLERMDGSFIVRDPVMTEGESLVCIGDVPAQSALHILHGRPAALMRASSSACRQALSGGVKARVALFVDCLSRALYLGPEHDGQAAVIAQELARSSDGPVQVFGVLSLGEIASPGAGCLEFHNKTFVLGLIPDASASDSRI